MNHLEPDVLETRVSSPTFDVAKVNNVMAKSAVPRLHAVAFSSPDRRHLTLMVINRSMAATIPTAIQFQGFTPQGEARVWTLSGTSPLDHNEHLSTTVTPQSTTLAVAGAGCSHTFAAHSLTVLDFTGQP
jgi:alpha-L-arabinofuranosidase